MQLRRSPVMKEQFKRVEFTCFVFILRSIHGLLRILKDLNSSSWPMVFQQALQVAIADVLVAKETMQFQQQQLSQPVNSVTNDPLTLSSSPRKTFKYTDFCATSSSPNFDFFLTGNFLRSFLLWEYRSSKI